MRLPGREGPPHEGPSHEGPPRDPPTPPPPPPAKKPLYPRLLRLQHISPNAWQRAVLGEGALGVGVLLAMADLASAWTVVVLPVAVAAVVKAHDLLEGLLESRR
ncbi:MAG: hypothetical protein LH469_13995 [Frankiaceae bacterium]|nr:hypothetical protein [Frankiaceae bacterium]